MGCIPGCWEVRSPFWPWPYGVHQDQWRCLHQKENHEYIWETNYLINYLENPQGHNLRAYDCPVVDPNDPQWCPADSNGQYYPVDCNCHAYYRCEIHSATDFTPKPCIYKCLPHDFVFDPNTKSCVREDEAPPGICYNTPTKPPFWPPLQEKWRCLHSKSQS